MAMNFEALAADLLANARDRLPQWFPAGRVKGHEFQVGNLSGADGDSLKINVNTGRWKDFATGDAGGDLISLYAAMHGLKQIDAAKQLANGHDYDGSGPAQPAAPKKPRPAARNVITPAPTEIESMRHAKFGEPSRTWRYADAENRTLGHVARYDPPGEKKQIVPWTYADGRWGAGQWLEPRPLYGLDELAKLPAAPVMIVEGEKAADAARQIVAGRYAVITWPGGSQAWRKVDWSPVTGRRVLLWPDADKAGRTCMDEIGAALLENVGDAKVIDVTGQPDGWDAADALAEGWDWANLIAWAKPRAKLITDGSQAAQEPAQRAPDPVVAPPPPPPPDEPPAAPKGGFYPHEGRPWSALMICTDKGMPKPLLANCITALMLDPEWKGVLAHDIFAMQTHAVRKPPINGGQIGPWADIYDIKTAEWLQRVGLLVSPLIAGQAVQAVAHECSYHPVRDYLTECRKAWDGKPRIDNWLTYYVGAHDAPYTRAIGAVFLIGAVARIFRPGVKLDTALILEGPQGRRKSMVFDVLGGKWFSDDVSELGGKDSKMEVAGAWILELAELSQMTRGDLETTKAFITRRVDRFRPPYGRLVVERARQCIFGGTSNNSDYLKDDENRRFLPIKVGERIDIEGLRMARDQLWGEAVARFENGEDWYIQDPEILAAARGQQDLRRQGDEWENLIVQWLADQGMAPPSHVTIGQVLKDVIGVNSERWTQAEQTRVARILKSLGWERFKKRTGSGMLWAYRRPESEQVIPAAESSNSEFED